MNFRKVSIALNVAYKLQKSQDVQISKFSLFQANDVSSEFRKYVPLKTSNLLPRFSLDLSYSLWLTTMLALVRPSEMFKVKTHDIATLTCLYRLRPSQFSYLAFW